MFPVALSERLDALIDDLIMDGGVEAASLASILFAAKDSVRRDYHFTLSRMVWAANADLRESLARDVKGNCAAAEPHAPGTRGRSAPRGESKV